MKKRSLSSAVNSHRSFGTLIASINKLENLIKAPDTNPGSVNKESDEYMQVMHHIGSMDVIRKVRNGGDGVSEHQLLKVMHGTNAQAINCIVQEGFKVGDEEVEMRRVITTGSASASPHSKSGLQGTRKKGVTNSSYSVIFVWIRIVLKRATASTCSLTKGS